MNIIQFGYKVMRLFFSLVIVFLNLSGFSQSAVVAGVVPPGFHLVTPSINEIQVFNCFSPNDSVKINFDQEDTLNDVLLHITPLCSSFARSKAYYLMMNPDFSFACGDCPNAIAYGPILYPVEPGQLFSNLWYQPIYSGTAILNSSGTFLGGSCNNGFGLCGLMRFVIVRKKVDGEYFYGWMDVTSCSSGGAQLNFVVNSLTLFPKITVKHDSIVCMSSYTFPDGFTLNNIIQDTVYDAVLATSNPNIDSLIRTRLHVVPIAANTLSVYDTTCGNAYYYFPDGDSIFFSNNQVTPFTYLDTSMLQNQFGCDSILIITNLYVWTSIYAFGSYGGWCNHSLSLPNGYIITNLLKDSIYSFPTPCPPNYQYGYAVQVMNQNLPAIYDTICFGENYLLPDSTLLTNVVSSLTLWDTIFSCQTCYIKQQVFLHVHPQVQILQSVSICSGSDFIFPDGITVTNITQDTTHISAFISSVGCDSTISTTLHITPNYSISSSLFICAGDSVIVGNHVYTTSGNYSDTLQTTSGCDSIIYTQLNVLPSSITGFNFEYVCPYNMYVFPDGTTLFNITQDTLQTSLVIGSNGCDSTILTQLYVVYIDTNLTLSGNVLSSNNSIQANYQWMDCASNTIIPGATNQNYSMPSAGAYAVIVDLYGCVDTSICFFTTDVRNIEESREVQINNPVTDRIQIHGLTNEEKFLQNSVGQMLYRTSENNIPVENLPQGIYFLRIGEYVWKVVKQ